MRLLSTARNSLGLPPLFPFLLQLRPDSDLHRAISLAVVALAKEGRRTARGSMTFLRCLRKYLFRLLFFPRIFFFSFSALLAPFLLFPSPSSSPAPSSSFPTSVSSAFPATLSLSNLGRRAYGISCCPSTTVVSFDGGAKEPTKSGSSAMASGWILSRRALTSRSRRAFLFSNGSASALSKFGSPAPGTRMPDTPAAWPIVRMSWKGQKRREESGRRGTGCVR